MDAVEQHLKGLTEWLQQQGAEILPTTNDFELLRFKGKRVAVIYKTGNVSAPHVRDTLSDFFYKKKWRDAPMSVGRRVYVKQKKQLLERDGSECFYCGLELGEDLTVEHLIPLTAGGTNLLSNMVLAHEKCNSKQGSKPLSEKVKYAIACRSLL